MWWNNAKDKKEYCGVPQHLIPYFRQLSELELSEPPKPWVLKNWYSVGGLMDVGFQPSSDLLLVISSSGGRGVFDCLTGAKVNRDEDLEFYFDAQSLIVASIEPMIEPLIGTAGLHGGGLAKGTNDGWSLDFDPTKWPSTNVYLLGGFQSLFWQKDGEEYNVTFLAENMDVRVLGFSPTGQSFIIGTPSDLAIYSRD